MSQNTCRLERMLDLHGCVDGGAFVGVELFACFGAGGEEDFVVIYILFRELVKGCGGRVEAWVSDVLYGRTFEGYTGGAEELAVGGDCGDGGCCHSGYLFRLVLLDVDSWRSQLKRRRRLCCVVESDGKCIVN